MTTVSSLLRLLVTWVVALQLASSWPNQSAFRLKANSRIEVSSPISIDFDRSRAAFPGHDRLSMLVLQSSSVAGPSTENGGVATSQETSPDSNMNAPPPTVVDEEQIKAMQQKIINGLILAVSFGYAIYTIFNIDHGMTRGWTQNEIAMRIPLDNWSNYESSLEEKPVFTKTLINVVIYLLGDWLSQTVFQRKNVLEFDPVRVLRNGFIGLCMGPLVHEYYQFSDTILPVEGGLGNRLSKIVMDQTIYLTVKCSAYIAAVGLLRGDDWETVKHSVQSRIMGIVFTAWKFWPLVHCITYSVIPARHRILWVNMVDLVWSAILASMSQKKDEPPLEEAASKNEILESAAEEKTPCPTAAEFVSEPFVLTQEVYLSALEVEVGGLFSESRNATEYDASLVSHPSQNSSMAFAT